MINRQKIPVYLNCVMTLFVNASTGDKTVLH